MNSPKAFAQLKPDLISMGFAFYGDQSLLPPDPEWTILQIIELCQTERKAFVMLLAWLEKLRELVHVERLKSLSSELSIAAVPSFGALCLKQVKQGDRRFSAPASFAKARMNRLPALPSSPFETDDFMISKYGADEEFQELGIRTARIAAADERKILTLDAILSRNPWLRIRSLMGANFRADIAYLMSSKRASNANQAMRILGCNLETAYRLWKSLSLAPDLTKLAG